MTSKPSTGATIPHSGFIGKLNSYVVRMTGQKKYFLFFMQGITFLFCKSMPTIFGSLLRGKVYRIILGRCGGGVLIESNVTLNIPRQIFLGNRIVLGESTVIDPRGQQGNIFIENDVHIQRWCRITTGGTASTPGRLTIKDSVYIGPYTYIHAAGNITIAKNCLFGPRVTIVGGKHNYKDKKIPIRLQGDIPQDIHIEEDVWVGANVMILGGVSIGKGAVIAAGSIVTKDIPPYSIAMGAPAKVKGTRE